MVAIEVSVQTENFESFFNRGDLVFDPNILDVEDSRFLLRTLEKEAFYTLICALRAQGPLSQYKELLIDHLRSIFFISEDECIAKMRIASNDPFLSKISETLNPSYDTHTEWAAASYSNIPSDIIVRSQDTRADPTSSKRTKKLHEMMNTHNKKLEDENEALLRLINLPKKVYVPEKLRKLLQDTEKDAASHIEIIKEKKIKEEKPVRSVGRPRKNTLVMSPPKEKIKPKKSVEIQTSPVKDAKSPKKFELPLQTIDEKKELTIQTVQAAQVPASVQPVDALQMAQNSQGLLQPHLPAIPQELLVSKLPTREEVNQVAVHMISTAEAKSIERKKRKEKADNATCICARVQPFIFERPAPGSKHKPPRGNPDKRTAKRSNSNILPYGQPVIFDSTMDPSAGTSSSANNTSDRPHILSNYGLPVPPKKTKVQIATSEPQTPSFPPNTFVAGLIPSQQVQQKSPRANPSGIRISGASYVANVGPLCSNPTRPYYGNPLVAARSIHPEGQTPSTSAMHFVAPTNIVLAQPQQLQHQGGSRVETSTPSQTVQHHSKEQKPMNLSTADPNSRPNPIYSITSLIPSTSQQLAMDILQKHVNAAKQDLNHAPRGPSSSHVNTPQAGTPTSHETMAANVFLDHDYRSPQQHQQQHQPQPTQQQTPQNKVHEYIVRTNTAASPAQQQRPMEAPKVEPPKQVVTLTANTSIVTSHVQPTPVQHHQPHPTHQTQHVQTPQRAQQKASNGPDLSFMKGSSGLEFLASTASILATLQSSRQAMLQQQQQQQPQPLQQQQPHQAQQKSNGPASSIRAMPIAQQTTPSLNLEPALQAIRAQQQNQAAKMAESHQTGSSSSSHFAPPPAQPQPKATTSSISAAAATVFDLKALAGLRADEQPTLGSLLADPHTRKLLVSTPNVFQNLDQRVFAQSLDHSANSSGQTSKNSHDNGNNNHNAGK